MATKHSRECDHLERQCLKGAGIKMRRPRTPKCLPVHQLAVDRQLLVSPRQEWPWLPSGPALFCCWIGPCRVGLPSILCPSLAPSPFLLSVVLRSVLQALGAWRNTHKQTGRDAGMGQWGQCYRGNWQVGLAAGFLELTPGWAAAGDPHVQGSLGETAGRKPASEGHQATFP